MRRQTTLITRGRMVIRRFRISRLGLRCVFMVIASCAWARRSSRGKVPGLLLPPARPGPRQLGREGLNVGAHEIIVRSCSPWCPNAIIRRLSNLFRPQIAPALQWAQPRAVPGWCFRANGMWWRRRVPPPGPDRFPIAVKQDRSGAKLTSVTDESNRLEMVERLGTAPSQAALREQLPPLRAPHFGEGGGGVTVRTPALADPAGFRDRMRPTGADPS